MKKQSEERKRPLVHRLPLRLQKKVGDVHEYRRQGANPAKITILGLSFNIVTLALLIVLFVGQSTGEPLPRWVLLFAIVLGILESILAIQSISALMTYNKQRSALARSVDELEALTRAMRAQRHDMKNHFQVISALLDMDEIDEAREYLDDISDDFQVLSLAMRTSEPAVNAMLQAKQALCKQAGVALELEITTPLNRLPMEPWEFCRILGNLIDNALEAMHDAAQRGESNQNPSIVVHLSEDERQYSASVDNNGPPIPEKDLYRIFKPGFSSKGEGRGLGLPIVHRLITEVAGRVEVSSDPRLTSFRIILPKGPVPGGTDG